MPFVYVFIAIMNSFFKKYHVLVRQIEMEYVPQCGYLGKYTSFNSNICIQTPLGYLCK